MLFLSCSLWAARSFASQAGGFDARVARAETNFHWFSVPIQITRIATHVKWIPVTVAVDFGELMKKLGRPGAIDERTLRLFRLDPDGSSVEIPVQFTPKAQPRPKERPLLSGTAKEVSYLGEYQVEDTPRDINVEGQLGWIARSGAQENRFYRLEFGVARKGMLVQVPFEPQNLRGFDEEGGATPVRWFPRMQFRPQRPIAGVINVLEETQLVTSYHAGPALAEIHSGRLTFRRPFLYPVQGLEGISLTEFGKPHDPKGTHAHHYSLWIAHASVNGHDFWSERGGLIVHQEFEQLEDGPVFCRLVQRNLWTINATNLLHERRELKFYAADLESRAIDVDLNFTPIGSGPITLGKTSFGFLAVRVAQSMTVFDGGGEIVNSRGDRNERGAHLKRAEWLDQSGPIAPGRWAGIAMLDHPENPFFPTGWHCRNDGWAGAAFNMEQAYRMEAGSSLRLRYRLVLHVGDAAVADIRKHHAGYAVRPIIQIGEPRPKGE